MNENDFVVGVLTYITCLREKKRYSTAKSYQDALRSFKCFCGREEIPYAYINRDTLLRYQSWLLAKGCARNTVSTYMRRIRHIYNLAVEVGEAAYIPHLFKHVFTGVESKRKRRCLRKAYACCDKPGDRSATEEDPISLLPDVFVLRDGFRRFGAFAKGGYQGRDLVLLSAEKRIPYTGGDPSGGTRAAE